MGLDHRTIGFGHFLVSLNYIRYQARVRKKFFGGNCYISLFLKQVLLDAIFDGNLFHNGK